MRHRARTRVVRLGFVREAGWVAIGQALGVIGSALGIRVLTQLLDPSSFGEIALGLSLAALTSQIAFGPLANAATRVFTAANEEGALHAFRLAVWRLTWKVTTVIGALCLIACLIGVAEFGLSRGALALAIATVAILSGWDAVLSGIQTAARRRGIVAWHQVLAQWLRPALAIVGVRIWGATSTSVMVASAFVSLIVVLSELWFMRHTLPLGGRSPDHCLPSPLALESQMWRYGLPFALYGLFTWLQIASDRWALEAFTDQTQVGLYAAMSQLGLQPFMLLGAAFAQLVGPVIFGRAGDGTDGIRMRSGIGLAMQVAAALFVGTLAAVCVAVIAHEHIVGLLLDQRYRSASWILGVVVAAGGLFSVGQLLAFAPMVVMKPDRLLRPKILTSLLGLGLNVSGAFFLGVSGVAFAALAFSAVYCAWMLLLALTIVRELPGPSQLVGASLPPRASPTAAQ